MQRWDVDTRCRLRYTFTHHTNKHAASVLMFVSGGDLGWRWVARKRAPPKAGAHFTPRTRSDTTLNFELKFARGHASHTPLAANSPYSLCLGVSRAWATRGASHHPYGSRYGVRYHRIASLHRTFDHTLVALIYPLQLLFDLDIVGCYLHSQTLVRY